MSGQAFSLDEQIGTVADEIGRREYALRDRVRLHRMSPEAAEREIALMKAVRETLVELRDRRRTGHGS